MIKDQSADVCPGCGKPLDACYYGGDCLEVKAIYRQQQREKLRDIDPDEIEIEREFGDAR